MGGLLRVRLQPDSSVTTSVNVAGLLEGSTNMNVMALATRADTPATIKTAFAKRSPVPLGSESEAAHGRRVAVDMVVGGGLEPRRDERRQGSEWVQYRPG